MSDPYRTAGEAAPPTPEEQLEELREERAKKAAAREEASKASKLAAAIEKEKQGILDDETIAKLREESDVPLGRVNTPFGMVVVKAPVGIVYRRLQDEMMRSDHQNAKVRTSAAEAAEKAAIECVVHPDRKTYKALVEKVSTLSSAVLLMALDLGKVEAVEEGK